jgi:hypothetical protein
MLYNGMQLRLDELLRCQVAPDVNTDKTCNHRCLPMSQSVPNVTPGAMTTIRGPRTQEQCAGALTVNEHYFHRPLKFQRETAAVIRHYA